MEAALLTTLPIGGWASASLGAERLRRRAKKATPAIKAAPTMAPTAIPALAPVLNPPLDFSSAVTVGSELDTAPVAAGVEVVDVVPAGTNSDSPTLKHMLSVDSKVADSTKV